MKGVRKLEYLGKTPDNKLQKCHILKPKNQASSKTRTRTLALVACLESRFASYYTLRHGTKEANNLWWILLPEKKRE